jgi:dolichyl-phosphate beta-glucosyltransferase
VRRVVVVPCFNEAARLDAYALRSLVDADTGLLFVDDGSTDGTAGLLTELARSDARIEVLALGDNVGKGEAVRRGMLRAIEEGAAVVGFLDADLAAPPAEMRRLLDALDADARMRAAIGARVALLGRHIERKPTRHYLGRVFATAASMTLHVPVYDTQCGAKAFRVDNVLRAALDRPFSSRWVFDVELLARLLDHSPDGVVELPLQEWRDVRGSSLGVRDMLGAGVDLLRLAVRRRR